MSNLANLTVLAAILLPAGLYIWLALQQRHAIKSIRDFFPLTRFLDGESYGRSTAASGVSLATVILALVNLAPILGLSLFASILSYALSFVFLYICAPAILRANPENDTIQAFLGKTYGSRSLRGIAMFFTFLGYISIFSMELLVGVTILQPFIGESVLIFAILYLFFIIAYSLISGFKAIVATEQWQIRFIIASVLVLVAFLVLLWNETAASISFGQVSKSVFSSWNAGWAFYLGVITMNLPAPISDSGTWQRLCSTSSEREARKGLARAIPMFLLIWGTLILFGCYIAQFAIVSGEFDPQSSSLMTFIVSSLAAGGILHLLLLFIFMLGLFAAMITTADSLLLVAAQMFSVDYLRLHEKPQDESSNIRKARISLTGIAFISFFIFTFFHYIKFDVVQLIFAIYGAQLALFPVVFSALFLGHRLELKRLGLAASLSVLGGFAGAWISAFYGKYGGNPNWLYNAPVVALASSSIIFLFMSFPSWKRHTHN